MTPEEIAKRSHPLLSLDVDDLDFILRVVLYSGSLKELAKHYGVSYPTIRSRLDRVISTLRDLVERRPIDPMAGLLADLVEKGQITSHAARQILDLSRKTLEKKDI